MFHTNKGGGRTSEFTAIKQKYCRATNRPMDLCGNHAIIIACDGNINKFGGNYLIRTKDAVRSSVQWLVYTVTVMSCDSRDSYYSVTRIGSPNAVTLISAECRVNAL